MISSITIATSPRLFGRSKAIVEGDVYLFLVQGCHGGGARPEISAHAC